MVVKPNRRRKAVRIHRRLETPSSFTTAFENAPVSLVEWNASSIDSDPQGNEDATSCPVTVASEEAIQATSRHSPVQCAKTRERERLD